MNSKSRVGLLTSRKHPLLPTLLDKLESVEGVELMLIFDQLDFSAKDQRLFMDRTQGAFPQRSLAPYLERHSWTEVPHHNEKDCLEYVKKQNVQLLVNAGTPRRIGAELIQASPLGILNNHPGILPKYRGATCCEWALYHDDPVGVTAHFMNTELDAGPIIFSEVLPIEQGEDYNHIRIALYRLAQNVCAKAIGLILRKRLTADQLPAQPPADTFKPIPDALLDAVKLKLIKGSYRHARPAGVSQ